MGLYQVGNSGIGGFEQGAATGRQVLADQQAYKRSQMDNYEAGNRTLAEILMKAATPDQYGQLPDRAGVQRAIDWYGGRLNRVPIGLPGIASSDTGLPVNTGGEPSYFTPEAEQGKSGTSQTALNTWEQWLNRTQPPKKNP